MTPGDVLSVAHRLTGELCTLEFGYIFEAKEVKERLVTLHLRDSAKTLFAFGKGSSHDEALEACARDILRMIREDEAEVRARLQQAQAEHEQALKFLQEAEAALLPE